MQKSKRQLINIPRPYLSWSQLSTWEQSPELYRRIYIEGWQKPENQYLRLGKTLADRMENGIETDNILIEHLALFLPKYPRIEFEIKAEWEGIPLLGRLDGFCPKELIIGEYKTGRLWTQSKVDKLGQLTFYAALVWIVYKKLPSVIKLHWAETELNEEGKIQIVGKIETFETKRTISDIILLRGRIVSAWQGIQKMCKICKGRSKEVEK